MAVGRAKSVWSGHSCPLPLTLVLLLILVWSGHPAGGLRGRLLMRRVKSKSKVKIRVRGSGQECPLYTRTNGDSHATWWEIPPLRLRSGQALTSKGTTLGWVTRQKRSTGPNSGIQRTIVRRFPKPAKQSPKP